MKPIIAVVLMFPLACIILGIIIYQMSGGKGDTGSSLKLSFFLLLAGIGLYLLLS